MGHNWLHRRRPDKGEGIGFGVASWEGALATLAFCAAFFLIPLAVTSLYDRLGGMMWPYVIVALGLAAVLLAGFLGLIVVKSDR